MSSDPFAPPPGRLADGKGAPFPDTKLARLLETESRLERAIAGARSRAEALVERARVAAAERRHEVEARLDDRARDLRREIEEETASAIGSIRERAARRARAFREADDVVVDALAARVVERLVDVDPDDP